MVSIDEIKLVFDQRRALAVQDQPQFAFGLRTGYVAGAVNDERIVAFAYISLPTADGGKTRTCIARCTDDGRRDRGGAALAIPIDVPGVQHQGARHVDDDGVVVQCFGVCHQSLQHGAHISL